MKFSPSKYQSRIFDFIESGKGNLVVNAVAGSGKSTTLIQGIQRIDESKSILFLAFNKSIVDELKKKTAFIENVEVSTLHGLGYKTILKNVLGRVEIDSNKYRNIAKMFIANGFLNNNPKALNSEAAFLKNVLKLVDLMRVEMCASDADIANVINKHGIEIINDEVSLAKSTINEGWKINSVIDYTDMIYFPAKKNMMIKKYDWVLIDECQDLNAAQRTLFLKCVNPISGRFIAVGDPRQAIYGFAGADVKSFNLLKGLNNTIELPLSCCYRCGKKIVEIAKGIVSQIECSENAEDGVIDFAATEDMFKDGDMVLCRKTSPLISLCLSLLAKDIKCFIVGKDVGKNLINLIKDTRKKTMAAVIKVLNDNHNKLINSVAKSNGMSVNEAMENQACINSEDRIEAIRVISKGLRSADDVVAKIESIFSDNNLTGIKLSTIHKSKGLESDNVFILKPSEIRMKTMTNEQAEQEANLEYVAYTRAKHFLGFLKEK